MVKPRTFFLNEAHELSREERKTGGSQEKLAPLDWVAKGTSLSKSLRRVREQYQRSKDPTTRHRYFMVALPEPSLRKRSKDKRKAPSGEFDEAVAYGGAHSWTFQRLGADLLSVTREGNALVHVTRDRFERLVQLAARISEIGPVEQSRWARVQGFTTVPRAERVDESWLASLPSKTTEAVIKLQPLLSRSEAEDVLRELTKLLEPKSGEGLRSTGSDFSGRVWVRGMLQPKTIARIAEGFASVQSIHPPLVVPLATLSPRKVKSGGVKSSEIREPADPRSLPVVGVVDGGIPENHRLLEGFRRGTFHSPEAMGRWVGPHGSMVASRVVFGDVDGRGGPPEAVGQFQYLDIRVAASESTIDEQAVVGAIQSCVGAYPDVRVYNLSFSDHRPYDEYPPVLRREKLALTQDLDNLIFQSDILVLVAAGNTNPGQVPIVPYPRNHEDRDWRLGHWAAGFNTLTSGSFTMWPRDDAVAKDEGAPSPFCKVGPGLAGAPIPEISDHGGNLHETYTARPHFGVYVLNERGLWQDESGTSFAVPVVSREAALAVALLEKHCHPGSRPFAATAKAFLALTSSRHALPEQYATLADLTLGRGRARAARLEAPLREDAIFLWQGFLEDARDRAQIQVPIPAAWLRKAGMPILELCVAWDVPVNSAVENIYGCREVRVALRPRAEDRAANPMRTMGRTPGHPLLFRTYDLRRILKKPGAWGGGDFWLLDLSYDEVAAYHSALDITPQQRVGVALRLVDKDRADESLQAAIQALPIASTMVRLSATPVSARVPVIIKSRA